MTPQTLLETAHRLRAIATNAVPAAILSKSPSEAAEFRDELGNRLAVDAALLASALDLPMPSTPKPPISADLAMWHAALADPPGVPQLAMNSAAPLLDHAPTETIEVWIESELTALHALWKIARRTKSDDSRRRCLAAAIWHVDNVQPDNATNHPWATHVFYWASVQADRWDLRHHADTLVHNALVGGTVRRRSALILLDSARELELL